MLTERALESFKQFVETNIAYAMVEYGGTMHKAKILTRERLKDGRVALSISITPEVSGTTTITKIQLYDTASKLWAEKSEAIKLKGTQQGVACAVIPSCATPPAVFLCGIVPAFACPV